mmetsp:Transcript_20228/g.30435  ORF Transcript_20228/g.30435 Transcript_20228/m.30435 type:complete len:133 (+) Transcript_20228:29-427(+)
MVEETSLKAEDNSGEDYNGNDNGARNRRNLVIVSFIATLIVVGTFVLGARSFASERAFEREKIDIQSDAPATSKQPSSSNTTAAPTSSPILPSIPSNEQILTKHPVQNEPRSLSASSPATSTMTESSRRLRK